ncbi:hypothetical protein LINPERPRIM_LOCUS2592 [Linum perenne]
MQEDNNPNPRCPRIPFTEQELRSFYKPWSKALVVKVLERSFSFLTIKRRLENLWVRLGVIQVCDLANDFFLVRFSEEADYKRAAFDGPWNVAVSRIGNCIGRTVRLDLASTEGARARYACVCVEVDLSKPLLGKYIIDDRTFLIEYESLENICFGCDIHGHGIDSCPSAPGVKEADIHTEEVALETKATQEDGDTGSWMTVQRRQQKKES